MFKRVRNRVRQLKQKMEQLKRDQMDAEKQINFLLDLEIAETTPPETDEDK